MLIKLAKSISIGFILFQIILPIQLCFSQQQYQEISYPDTTSIVSILPLSYDTIFIGTNINNYEHGGVYRSFDGGLSWEFVGIEHRLIYSMLHGTGDTILVGSNYGMYRSANLGNTWELILQISDNIVSLARLPSGELFAGTWGVLLRSVDGGSTWDTSLVIGSNAVVNDILPIDANEIYSCGTKYIGTGGGVFMSEDLGDTWENIGLEGFNVQSLAYNNSDHELFAGCYFSGLLKTADYGDSWDTILPFRDVTTIVRKFGDMSIGIHGQSFPIAGIFYSPDNGVTWEDRTYNITNPNIKQLVITPDNYLYSLSIESSLGPAFYRSANPVKINEISPSSYPKIKIYPNPAISFFNISVPSINKDTNFLEVNIYNQEGKLARKELVLVPTNINIYQFNIENLTSGIYFVKIVCGKFSYLNKLIIH